MTKVMLRNNWATPDGFFRPNDNGVEIPDHLIGQLPSSATIVKEPKPKPKQKPPKSKSPDSDEAGAETDEERAKRLQEKREKIMADQSSGTAE